MTSTLEIQQRLKALGFDPGPLDGVHGRLTMRAVAAFQAARRIDVRWPGTAGPATLGALFPETARPSVAKPPWMAEAERHLGLREVVGKAHNSTILRWLERLNASWRDDETAWCGTFVGWCIAATLRDEPLPTPPFAARSWLHFGIRCAPAPGAVLVFSRPPSAWTGHVGFHAGEDRDAFHVLGGNQSDAVTTVRIARSRLLGARWPVTVSPPSAGRVDNASHGSLSINEA